MSVQPRTHAGIPLPSWWQAVVICVALVAAGLVWTNYGRVVEHPVPDVDAAENPVKDLHSVEAFARRRADAVPGFVAALDSADPRERRLAVLGLGKIGSEASEALEKIRSLLADEAPAVREEAAMAVVQISEDKRSAATSIAPLLADPEKRVQEAAVAGLLQIGRAALPSIVTMLQSDSPAARLMAVRTLQKTRQTLLWNLAKSQQSTPGEPDQESSEPPQSRYSVQTEIGEAIRTLADDDDPAVRKAALCELAERGLATADQVRELLHDEDLATRDLALRAVPSLKEEAAQFLPDVLDRLSEEVALEGIDSRKHTHATGARLQMILVVLRGMKERARPAIERLLEISDKRRDYSCISMAETIHAIGASDAEIGRALQPLWSTDNESIWRAGMLLVKIAPQEARRQVSLLIPKLGHVESGVDKKALFTIYALGQEGQEAIPALVPLLKSPDKWVVEFAAHALQTTGLGTLKDASEMAAIVVSGSWPFRQRLTFAAVLENSGAVAAGAVPALLDYLATPDPAVPADENTLANWQVSEWSVRIAVVKAVARIGGDDPRCVPTLRSQLASRSPALRAAIVEALPGLAPNSAEVLSDLVRRMRDDDRDTQIQSVLAVGRMQADRGPAVEPLAMLLHDDDPLLRAAAAMILGEIGPVASSALAALRKAVSDPRNERIAGGGNSQDSRDTKLRPLRVPVHFGEKKTISRFAESAIAKIEPAATGN